MASIKQENILDKRQSALPKYHVYFGWRWYGFPGPSRTYDFFSCLRKILKLRYQSKKFVPFNFSFSKMDLRERLSIGVSGGVGAEGAIYKNYKVLKLVLSKFDSLTNLISLKL